MPIVLGVVFTASKTLTGLLVATLIPLYFAKSLSEIITLASTLYHMNDAFFANASEDVVINMNSL